MIEIHGNIATPEPKEKEINGNVKRSNPYSYSRIPSGGWGIFKKVTEFHANKIAEVNDRSETGRQTAFEIVCAMNARAKWLEKQDFNKA